MQRVAVFGDLYSSRRKCKRQLIDKVITNKNLFECQYLDKTESVLITNEIVDRRKEKTSVLE